MFKNVLYLHSDCKWSCFLSLLIWIADCTQFLMASHLNRCQSLDCSVFKNRIQTVFQFSAHPLFWDEMMLMQCQVSLVKNSVYFSHTFLPVRVNNDWLKLADVFYTLLAICCFVHLDTATPAKPSASGRGRHGGDCSPQLTTSSRCCGWCRSWIHLLDNSVDRRTSETQWTFTLCHLQVCAARHFCRMQY